MNLLGYIVRLKNDEITIRVKNLLPFQKALVKIGLGSLCGLEIDDGRSITSDQRKKAFAMIHDISEYTGYSLRETEELMKARYITVMAHPKWFSLSDCNIEIAKAFIEFMIEFCINQNIPFTTKVFDEIQQSYGLRVQLLTHRICYVCGENGADVDHVNTIGIGRNRRHVNQNNYYAWSLCRKHHTERHTIGIKQFAQKYQIKPVKLNAEIIKKLNLSNEGALENGKSN